jgi:glycosyltransferase involved in cell wall biosynthesis
MLVSILIPCYNAEPWVAQAIESALAQTWRKKEVIVVDDGSTDGSLNVIKRFGDRIRWETGPNCGGNPARNRLLELARGEWLQYLDADDHLLPDKIAKQMAFVAAHHEADIVFGPVTLEHCGEREVRRQLLPIPEPHDVWILLARWHLPQTGALLWRKESILHAGGWRSDQPCCQEHELYLRLLMADKKFFYSASGGAVYRQWGEHTVCKRDKPELRRRRLDIEQRAEDFLRERGELTRARLSAINQARFEVARIAWKNENDRGEAVRIMGVVSHSQPHFAPLGTAVPTSYRLVFRFFGFQITETIAEWRRRVYQPRREQFHSPLSVNHVDR